MQGSGSSTPPALAAHVHAWRRAQRSGAAAARHACARADVQQAAARRRTAASTAPACLLPGLSAALPSPSTSSAFLPLLRCCTSTRRPHREPGQRGAPSAHGPGQPQANTSSPPLLAVPKRKASSPRTRTARRRESARSAGGPAGRARAACPAGSSMPRAEAAPAHHHTSRRVRRKASWPGWPSRGKPKRLPATRSSLRACQSTAKRTRAPSLPLSGSAARPAVPCPGAPRSFTGKSRKAPHSTASRPHPLPRTCSAKASSCSARLVSWYARSYRPLPGRHARRQDTQASNHAPHHE